MLNNNEQIIKESSSKIKNEVSDVSKENGLIYENTQDTQDKLSSGGLKVTQKIKNSGLKIANDINDNKLSSDSNNNSINEMIFPKEDLEFDYDIIRGSKEQYDINYNFEVDENNFIHLDSLNDFNSHYIYYDLMKEYFCSGKSSLETIYLQKPEKIDKSHQKENKNNINKLPRIKNKDIKLKKKRVRYNCKDSKNNNNGVRSLKLILCNSIYKFTNNVLKKVYNNNIGNGIKKKNY